MTTEMIQVSCPVCDDSVYAEDRMKHLKNHSYRELVVSIATIKLSRVKSVVWT